MTPATAAGMEVAAPRRSVARSRDLTGVALVAPALLAIAVLAVYPIVWLIDLSLHSSGLGGLSRPVFVGLGNYARIASSPDFVAALIHTIGFVAANFVLEAAIALPLALALHRRLRFSRLLRTVVSLPLMVAPVVASLAWRFMFASGYGLIASATAAVGLPSLSWFAHVWSARLAVLIVNLWLALPFDTLVLLAGFAGIPREIEEAAAMDGASALQRLRLVVLPLLTPVLLTVLVVRLADAFRIFDVVYVLTGSGPANSTDVLSTYVYRLMFTNLDFSGGAAAASLLVAITALVALASIRVARRRMAIG